MRIRIFGPLLFCAIAVLTLTYCVAVPRSVYVTEAGIEPDKWAAVWLIKRYLDPDAQIVMRPVGLPLDGGVVFAAGDGPYGRTPTRSAFGNMVSALQMQDPAMDALASHLDIIELSAWMSASDPNATLIEQQFRSMQEYFGRESVPESCYLVFFDAVYQLIGQRQLAQLPSQTQQITTPGAECQGNVTIVDRDMGTNVRQVPANEALARIDRGEKIVFIDVRETPEFAENHIPGALHRTLRNIDKAFAEELQDADLVIPYCVKDFRGYEAARELQRQGLTRVAILKPFGIAGWKNEGLPVWERERGDEQSAIRELKRCAAQGGEECAASL